MSMAARIVTIMSVGFLAGCDPDTGPGDHSGPYQVTVHDEAGNPVGGARIEGGIDWDMFSVETNAAGEATLPGSARTSTATIYKTNYLPYFVYPGVTSDLYTLCHTSRQVNLVGDAVGYAIRFQENEILTLDNGGTYRVYNFTDHLVTETFSTHLHDSATSIHDIRLLSDTLWFATHESGIFAFRIQNPLAPQFLFRLSIPGYPGQYVVSDSILILSTAFTSGPIRFLRYLPTGSYHEISRISNYNVWAMKLIGSTLVLLGPGNSPTAFDISDLRAPRLLYHNLWGSSSGIFFEHYAILTPPYGSRGYYRALDMTNPGSPAPLSPFSADSWILDFSSTTSAFGRFNDHTQTISVLEGQLSTYFATVATVSENRYNEVGGAFPPYYLIGNRLWRLTDR